MNLIMSKRGHSLKRPSTTMRNSGGETLGRKGDWILASSVDNLIKNIGKRNTVECHIPLHGLQNTLLWMVNKYYGTENSEWLDGTLISGCGEYKKKNCVHVGNQ